MLKSIKSKAARAQGGSYVIVASRYNATYVNALLSAARTELQNASAKVRIIRVPGAFEIPAVAARLAEKNSIQGSRSESHASRSNVSRSLSAIICFGVIFQGETPHAQHISWGVTHALAQIQVLYKLPIVHGVFLFEKEKHARVRCLGTKHNRGTEAAQTALQMGRVMGQVR
jgi:6,7-dimethyl-8-ribityllumazine synthase